MSRITYFSEKEGYDVAANIRKTSIRAMLSISIPVGLTWIGSVTINSPKTVSKIHSRC